MSVVVDARTSGGKTTGATSLSWSHTVGAGLSNGVLAALTTTGAPSAVHMTSETYNTTEALSILGGNGDANCENEIWLRKLPSAGSHTLQVNAASSCEITGGSISAQYVHQTTTWNAASPQGATGSSGQPTVNATSEANALVLAVAFSNESGGSNDLLVPGAGQTQIHSEQVGANKHSGASSDKAGATSVTMSFSGVTGGNGWGILAGSLTWDGIGGSTPVTTQPAAVSPIPMRPGAGGLKRGRPFRFDTSNPVPSTATILADSSLSLPLSGTASATVLVQGTSSSALPLSGSAATTNLVQAASSVSLPLSGVADATVLVQGSSSTSLPLSGAATGTVLVQAGSSATLGLTGSATLNVTPCPGPPYAMVIPMRAGPGGLSIGRPFRFDNSNPVPLTATAFATSSLQLPLTGSATGTVTVQAASIASLPLAAAAAGTVLAQAASTVSLALAGAAAGTVLVQAASSVPLPFSGSASATIGAVAIADSICALPLAGAANGLVLVQCASIKTLPLFGAATGTSGGALATRSPTFVTVTNTATYVTITSDL